MTESKMKWRMVIDPNFLADGFLFSPASGFAVRRVSG
jgi:hypothetical protein